MSKLDKIVELQSALMTRLGINPEVMSLDNKMRETHRFLTAIICEVVEILHEKGGVELAWKNWKKSGEPANQDYIKRELIDILHFTVELLILWGADADEIFAIYVDKNHENHARQDRSY